MWIDDVTEVLCEAAETVIAPRFRSLAACDVEEKAPDELVTVADREAEELITRGLRAVIKVPVVGEEAAAANSGLLDSLREEPLVWLVDPLDGTANFVAGSPDYAVMAALVREGQTVASWIVRPGDGIYVAERGSGAWKDGVQLHRAPAATATEELHGVVLTRFLPADVVRRLESVSGRFASLGPGTRCAGVDYSRLVGGDLDFVLFHRTLPWDHAPGVLLLTEAGGVACRPDGTAYCPGDDRPGLLNAADHASWATVRDLLYGSAS